MSTLASLPPPPQGQTGVPLSSLKNLPPPPTGQQGVSLQMAQSQPSAPTPQVPAPAPDFMTHLGNIASSITDFLGLHGTVDTLGTNAANIGNVLNPSTSLDQKVAMSKVLPQTSLADNLKAGAELGLTIPAPEIGVAVAAKGASVIADKAAANSASKLVEMVSPKQTSVEAAQSLHERGGTKTGILGTIKANIDPSVQRIADTVKEHVPDFNPKDSLIENINATKTAVSSLAEELKAKVIASGKDRIYSFKELGASLKGIEKPTLIAADSTLNRAYDLVTNKALEIARENGGKISDLFQARKEFDAFILKQFPNLYSSETLTPMRTAIKGIRNAMTDFTAEHLPPDIALHDSLTTQSRLISAIENMSEKAVSGIKKEVGTNALERAGSIIKNHPVIGGFGGIAAYEAAKKIPIVGAVLP